MEGMMPKRFAAVLAVSILAFFAPAVGSAVSQTTPLAPARTISVEGRSMRIVSSGLEQRKAGHSVVILETGAGEPGASPMETWRRFLPEIARLAP
jgi:hypothetical protein